MSPYFGYAAQVAQPKRYKESGFLNRMCTPAVLEVVPKQVRRVAPHKFCSQGPIGAVLDGLQISAVHFNLHQMVNHMQLESPLVRQHLTTESAYFRLCACGLCGQYSDPDNARFWDCLLYTSPSPRDS